MRARPTLVALAITLGAAMLISGVAVADSHEGETKMAKAEMMKMPFGGEEDVAFARALWTAMDGYHDWMMKSDVMPSKAPHGAFVRLYYNIVNIDGMPYHVVVKDNFGGEDATLDMVKAAPADYLMAVTVMVQREPGYDTENNDWFYVKYDAMGAVSMNDKDMALAGRVAKGMPTGCISCHVKAGGGDYIFGND
jgi:hypothetical protein